MFVKAKLIHQQNSQYGFKFESADLDSMIHLRCCLEYNSEQPEKIQDELFFLVDQTN